MKYLLDVNALLALGVLEHTLHDRVAEWARPRAAQPPLQLMTCPIVELGFVRVLAQVPQYGFTVKAAKRLLAELKASESSRLGFIADNQGAEHLPAWADAPSKTTDGHLLELAKSNGALLATLDERIPGAFLIPVSPAD